MRLANRYHLSYDETEENVGIERSSTRLMRKRLPWTGHMLWSEDSVFYKSLVFGPAGGARAADTYDQF